MGLQPPWTVWSPAGRYIRPSRREASTSQLNGSWASTCWSSTWIPWDQRWADTGRPPVHLPLQPVCCSPSLHQAQDSKSLQCVSKPPPRLWFPDGFSQEVWDDNSSEENSKPLCPEQIPLILCKMLWKDFPHSLMSEDGLSVRRREVSGAPPLRKTLTPSYEVSIKLGPPHKDTQSPAMMWRQNVWKTAAWLTDAQSISRDVILTSGNRAPNRPRNNKINGLESKNLIYELSEFPRLADSLLTPRNRSTGGWGFQDPLGEGGWQRTAGKMDRSSASTSTFHETKYHFHTKLLWTSVKQIAFTQTASKK